MGVCIGAYERKMPDTYCANNPRALDAVWAIIDEVRGINGHIPDHTSGACKLCIAADSNSTPCAKEQYLGEVVTQGAPLLNC